MSENLLGLLHTNYEQYGSQINFHIPSVTYNYINDSISSKIQTLEAAENAVYGRIIRGANDFESFISKIRELFNEKDKMALRFFKNEELRKHLQSYRVKGKKTTQVDITISNFKFPINFEKMIQGTGAKIVTSGRNTTLTFEGNKTSIKQAISQIVGINTKSSLSSILDPNKFAQSFTEKWQNAGESIISITTNTGSKGDVYHVREELKPLFEYTANDFHAIKNNPIAQAQLKQQMLETREELKEWIISTSGLLSASQELIYAFNKVWANNIDNSFENFALFEKNGVLNGLIGAFGEFQVALIFEFINLKGIVNPGLQATISNTLKSEQAKADVTIFNTIGIQVKNYNPYSSKGKLSTTIHPSKLIGYPDVFDDNLQFLTFIANYFFNATFQNENKEVLLGLESYLGMFFAELANMAIVDSVNDTVSFYLIEGKYFIPCSYLLRMVREQQQNSRQKVTITGPTSLKTDDQFLDTNEVRNKSRRENLASNYWVPYNGDWKYTVKNKSTYGKLISNDIAIRSELNYKALQLSYFAIFDF